jgi:serine/threonine protein kinase
MRRRTIPFPSTVLVSSSSTTPTAAAAAVPTMQPPKEWPTKVTELFDPIRTLGVGSFASVVLAKRKHNDSNETSNTTKLVAIKIVGDHRDGLTRSEIGYARRETGIVKAFEDHHNIMNVIEYWEPDYGSTQTAAMALSYCRGPTLEALIQHGGALSSTFGRVVMAQMVDAISALHSRAVVHRDIKPDNIIVMGASSKQDEVWDEEEGSSSENEDGKTTNTAMSWEDLRKKWHVTVIDFGFARALSPQDVASPPRALRRENLNASYHDHLSKKQLLEISECTEKTDVTTDATLLDRSMSRQFNKRMSALGTKMFCAPEIMNQVVAHDIADTTGIKGTNIDITKNLTSCASEYGLLVDAYSLGQTFRYMMTGVPPGHKGKYTVTAGNNKKNDDNNNKKPVTRRIGSWIKKKLGASKAQSSSAGNSTRKVKQLRLEDVVEKEAIYLIEDLTESEEDDRLSVRGARRKEWLSEVLPESTNTANNQTIEFLDFVLVEKDGSAIKAEGIFEPPAPPAIVVQ